MLCPKCEEIDFRFLDNLPPQQQKAIEDNGLGSADYYYFILHDTFTDLTRSVEQGCHLCNVIFAALTKPPQSWEKKGLDVSAAADQEAPVVLRSWSSKQKTPFVDNVLAGPLIGCRITVMCRDVKFDLGLLGGLNERLALPSHGLGLELCETGGYDADSTTGAQGSLELLKEWLNDCKENHPQCRGPKTPLPTRVIDVGSSEENREPQLLDTAPNQRGEYVALSHCWGKPELQIETQAWAADPYNLLPLKEWPQTFQHAARIARALAIPYLWIDTACIKQNSQADFIREASKMAEYYSGATLVIGAVHAEDSRKGCFIARNPLFYRPCPIGFKDYTDKPFFVNLVHESKFDESKLEPLHTRAWCFQEYLLSRRIALFCKDQLHWSCLGKQAKEDNPEGRKVEDISPQARPLVTLRAFLHYPLRKAVLHASEEGHNQELVEWQKKMGSNYLMYQQRYSTTGRESKAAFRDPAYQKWYDCVEYFTKCNITYVRDTLPALSGLATKMHEAVGTDDVYYAGLWSGDIVRGLLWAVLAPSQWPPNTEYVAPSWSWASRMGQRISSFFDETYMCDPYARDSPSWRDLLSVLEPQNLRVDMELKYPSAVYGEVASGKLYCSARLLHGGRVGKPLLFGESIYRRAHPAYHRGLGGLQINDKIFNWQLTIPAEWAVEPSAATQSRVPADLEGEIAIDVYSIAHMFSWRKKTHLEGQDVSVLLLWPFKFQGDRCIGLGLVRTDVDRNEYKRVGRVEFVIPYEKLWAWTQSQSKLEEMVIV